MLTLYAPRYGRLELRERPEPELPDDAVLMRVRAASINPADWYGVMGRPWFARPMMGLRAPKDDAVGADVAGTIEATGKDVTGLQRGDEVFGRTGAVGELAVATKVVRKPANVSFEEVASLPIAAGTALQGLRDKGQLERGQRVLVNGASGGVGTYAVQIAKALGAEVTAVCSTANVDLVRSLGADHVVDYTREDFTRSGARYDLLLDVAGSRSWHACTRVLAPEATVVLVGGPKRNRLLGPVGHIGAMLLASKPSSRNAVFFIANINVTDLAFLAGLLESGEVKSVIDRRYPFAEAADAFRYLGEGHARGKIVLTL
jgi:NADPH:quinone reductase-like Zn-dependent oxidoreductase